MLARSGLPLFVIVDTLMVGRIGANELAYLSLGITPTLTLMLVGVGILQGGMIMSAQAFGAGEKRLCGQILRTNLAHGLVIGIVFGLLCLAVPFLMGAMGIAPDLVAGATGVARQVAWSMPFMLSFIACQYFLEAIKRPFWGLIIIVAANILNVPLNFWLVYDLQLGAYGATLGSSILRSSMAIAIILVLVTLKGKETFDIHLRMGEIFSRASLELGKRMRRLGAPVGFVQFVETSTMTMLALFAGQLGAVASATQQVTMNVNQFIYMLAVGMAAATSIRVAHAVGDADGPAVRRAGFHGAAIMGLLIVPTSVLLLIFPRAIASLFTSDPQVLDIAQITIRIAAVVVIFQTQMSVFLGGLRGVGDVFFTLRVQAAVYWLILVPCSYTFAIAQKWGVPGLIFGLFVGVSVSCAIYAFRFYRISSRPVARH